MGTEGDLPFWQVNVPPELRQEECPVYLQGLSEKDKAIIGTRDEDFAYVQWPQVKEYIGKGQLPRMHMVTLTADKRRIA